MAGWFVLGQNQGVPLEPEVLQPHYMPLERGELEGGVSRELQQHGAATERLALVFVSSASQAGVVCRSWEVCNECRSN